MTMNNKNVCGDEGGGRAMTTMVKKRVTRAARAMGTRVVGNKEGGSNG